MVFLYTAELFPPSAAPQTFFMYDFRPETHKHNQRLQNSLSRFIENQDHITFLTARLNQPKSTFIMHFSFIGEMSGWALSQD